MEEAQLLEELSFITRRMEITTEALQLATKLAVPNPQSKETPLFPSQLSCLPDLNRFFPQTFPEIEIQLFNLFGILPERILTPPPTPTTQQSTTSTEKSASSENKSTTESATNNSSTEAASSSSQTQTTTTTTPTPLPIEEELMMWLLEKDSLQRETIATFLLQPTLLARNTLIRLLYKICGLEIGQGFVEGLKYFFLVSGMWDKYLSLSLISTTGTDRERDNIYLTFRSVLTLYIQTHFTVSKKPLFSALTTSSSVLQETQINILLEICYVILDTCKTLHGHHYTGSLKHAANRFVRSTSSPTNASGPSSSSSSAMTGKTLNSALSEFCNALRLALKRPSDSATSNSTSSQQHLALSTGPATANPSMILTTKAMTDMFHVIANTPMIPLRAPLITTPSYLFANVFRTTYSYSHLFSGDGQKESMNGTYMIQVGFDYNYQDSLRYYHIKLCKDALYFFVPISSTSTSTGSNEGIEIVPSSSYVTCNNQNESLLLSAMIPLTNIHIQRASYDDNYSVIELFDLQGERVPWIEYGQCIYHHSHSTTAATTSTVTATSSTDSAVTAISSMATSTSDNESKLLYRYPVPKSIELYERIFLDFSTPLLVSSHNNASGSGGKGGNSGFVAIQEAMTNRAAAKRGNRVSFAAGNTASSVVEVDIEDWVDTLENVCWDCRSHATM